MIHSTIMADSSKKLAMVRTFTIGDFSKLTGVHVNSLLYYEKLGILKPARVDPRTGYRHYSLSQLRIVEAIQLCVRAGVSLEAFAALQGGAGAGVIRYDRLLGGAIESLRATIAHARALLREVQSVQTLQRQGEDVAAGKIGEVRVPAHWCFIRAVLPGENPDDAYFALLQTMGKARLRIGYDNGALIIRRDGVERRYLYVDIAQNETQPFPAHCCLRLPAARWQSQVAQRGILEPDVELPAGDCVVMERDLFTGDFAIDPPRLERLVSTTLQRRLPKWLTSSISHEYTK